MTVRSLRILCQLDFPSKTVRLWDGSGPFLDATGEVWQGAVLRDGLDVVESAMNGEAYTLVLGISGVATDALNIAYEEAQSGDVVGSRIRLMIQDCDDNDQPLGLPQTRFTGTIDNIIFDETVVNENPVATVSIECVNRFTLRTATAGSVLSDIDQKARSALINPGAPPDKFAERIPILADKTIVWPRFS